MNSEVPARHNLDAFIAKDQKEGFQMNGLTYLIIVLAIVGVLLYLFKPSFVLSKNPETGVLHLDWSKLFVWTLIIGVGVLIVFFLTRNIHNLI